MILKSIRVEGIGCIADPLTVGPLSPGINILHSPNGIGKTTLFRSVGLGLLEGHRSKTSEIQSLRSWGCRLTPQVGLEFEHASQSFRLRKRFLDGASSHLERRQGNTWSAFAQGDSADEFLRELLLSDADRTRFTKPESWGLAQVLWATQGELGLPKFTPKVIEYIHGSIGAQIALQDSGTEARVESEYLKYFSPARGKLKTGKTAAAQLKCVSERDRLVGQQQAAEELLRQFEMNSSAVERIRAEMVATFSRKEALLPGQTLLRQSVEQHRTLQFQRKEGQALKDAAQSRQKAIRDRMEAIRVGRKQVSDCKLALAQTSASFPQSLEDIHLSRAALAAAKQALCVAVAAEEQAHRSIVAAHDASEYIRTVAEFSAQSERTKRIAAAELQIQTAQTKKAGLVAPSDSEILDLREITTRETDLRRRLELARVTVTLNATDKLELTVTEGENTGTLVCESGSTVSLSGTPNLCFSLSGVGGFAVNGPETNYQQIEADLAREQLALSSLRRRFGTTDTEVLESRRQEVSGVNSAIQVATRALSELRSGQTQESIALRSSELTNKLCLINAKYPIWKIDHPDALTLTSEATEVLAIARTGRDNAEQLERSASSALSAAESFFGSLQATQNAQEKAAQNADNMLTQQLIDGVTDQQRLLDLDEAVLNYDSCRLVLRGVEEQLQAFLTDPALALERIDNDLANLERSLQQADRTLIQTETKLSGIADCAPYGQLAEISEQLSAVEAKLNREQRHTSAIALLRNTFQEVKAEMMTSIAAPVEKAATQYLEQICDKPLAQIRLTPNFSADHVAPFQLADSSEKLVELERLSGGEREQVFLCTRLALAVQLARHERQMVVLDDVLSCTDPERLPRICDLLEQLADRLQVIILTCHPERFDRLTGANRINLERLLLTGRRAAA